MQEKIIEEMKHWGEDEDYTQNNLDAYDVFARSIDEIVHASNIEDFSKEEVIEMLKEELKRLEEELK